MHNLTAERWRRLEEILDRALDLEPEARPALLDRECSGDPALRRDVETLLHADALATGFLADSIDSYAAALAFELDVSDRSSGSDTIGALLGPYRIVREIGRGGMGAVYLAERADGQFEHRVALKLVKHGLDSDDVHQRFLAERQILARLNHPNIARLLDGGRTPSGQPWFAMEYVDGEPITHWCDARRIGLTGRLALFAQVCDAVRYAHQNLVVHRDLKPSNILVTSQGAVKLLDFGIARLLHEDPSAQHTRTELGRRVMTPEYAAPEQVRGEPVSTAVDVYALGAVLYELLTGRRAHRFTHRSATEVERVVCDVMPSAPSAVVTTRMHLPGVEGGTDTWSPEQASAARALSPARLKRALAGDLDNIILTALRKEPG
ncbi:MAG TPA: serine/threonine-protein kinase, partial [Gemmatimonadaceae bacterium]|nr:serine/threonine-protein kinase [Gemmatimonadaceae bacterium]